MPKYTLIKHGPAAHALDALAFRSIEDAQAYAALHHLVSWKPIDGQHARNFNAYHAHTGNHMIDGDAYLQDEAGRLYEAELNFVDDD